MEFTDLGLKADASAQSAAGVPDISKIHLLHKRIFQIPVPGGHLRTNAQAIRSQRIERCSGRQKAGHLDEPPTLAPEMGPMKEYCSAPTRTYTRSDLSLGGEMSVSKEGDPQYAGFLSKTPKHRCPFGKIDGPGTWKNKHLNQRLPFLTTQT